MNDLYSSSRSAALPTALVLTDHGRRHFITNSNFVSPLLSLPCLPAPSFYRPLCPCLGGPCRLRSWRCVSRLSSGKEPHVTGLEGPVFTLSLSSTLPWDRTPGGGSGPLLTPLVVEVPIPTSSSPRRSLQLLDLSPRATEPQVVILLRVGGARSVSYGSVRTTLLCTYDRPLSVVRYWTRRGGRAVTGVRRLSANTNDS